MGFGRFISFLGILVLFAPSAALAQQGTITGINTAPASAVTCSLEKITVTGTGSCPSGTISIDAGDYTPIPHVPGASFPLTFYHTYTWPGSYALKAQGQGTCSGTITTNLNVLGPTITSVPLAVFKPKGAVIFQGQHFGSLPGQILIHLTDYTGKTMDLPLEGIQWSDTFVAGTIPMVVGVFKQQAIFTVITRCLANTTFGATFTPITDVEPLPFDRITCSTSIGASVSDECQNWGGTNYPAECFNWPGPYGTGGGQETGYFGFHSSGWGGGNTGYDQFWPSPPLKNGWVYDSWTVGWYDVGGGSHVTITGVNTSNSAVPTLGANWHADACGLIDYSGDIFIAGPKGVPF